MRTLSDIEEASVDTDGFTGEGVQGGCAIFHDKAKNIRDEMRYSNLTEQHDDTAITVITLLYTANSIKVVLSKTLNLKL